MGQTGISFANLQPKIKRVLAVVLTLGKALSKSFTQSPSPTRMRPQESSLQAQGRKPLQRSTTQDAGLGPQDVAITCPRLSPLRRWRVSRCSQSLHKSTQKGLPWQFRALGSHFYCRGRSGGSIPGRETKIPKCTVAQFSSAQLLSRVQLLVTPWTTARQASLSITNSQVYPNPHPWSRFCHPTISSSVVPFSSCPQSFPESGSFPMSQLFKSGGQSIGVSASASVLPVNIQDWLPLGWSGWISMQSKGLSRVFSNTTVQKYQSFGTQLTLWSNSHIHTWPLGKRIALTRWTFVIKVKVMSLLFNMLSLFVIVFLWCVSFGNPTRGNSAQQR